MRNILRLVHRIAPDSSLRHFSSKKDCKVEEFHGVPTLNDFPKLLPDYNKHYEKRTRNYNMHLVLGVGSFVATLLLGKALGMLEFYNDIPEEPLEIGCYRDFDGDSSESN